MAWMFKGATAFNQPVGDWDTSQVTNMHEMFYDATAFNQPLHKWDISKVTTMSAMFQGASHFNQDIGDWNTKNVKDMGFTFKEADVFNQNIGNWNTSNVTNMRAMFQGTNHFNQNLSKWDTKKVTDISFMFDHAIAFNSPLFVSTDNVTKMEATFVYAKSLDTDQAHAISGWKTDKVEIFDNMFRDTHVMPVLSEWKHADAYTCTGIFSHSSVENSTHKADWMKNCPQQ